MKWRAPPLPVDFEAALRTAEMRDDPAAAPTRKIGFDFQFDIQSAALSACAHSRADHRPHDIASRYAQERLDSVAELSWDDFDATPDLAALLAFDACATRDEVLARRRQIARRYHPDLVPPDRRDAAERIMKSANALIDSHLLDMAARKAL